MASFVIAISSLGAVGAATSGDTGMSRVQAAPEDSERAVFGWAEGETGFAEIRGGRDSSTGPVSPSRSETCSAHKAVKFYAGRIAYWRSKMGAGNAGRRSAAAPSTCPQYLAHVLQRKAYALRARYERWHAYHYDWRSWLPAKWYRIARCETGVRWDWNSGRYQGAFGFAVSSWDAFKVSGYPSEAYLASPRQQYEVALNIWRRYGFSGWGCRNA